MNSKKHNWNIIVGFLYSIYMLRAYRTPLAVTMRLVSEYTGYCFDMCTKPRCPYDSTQRKTLPW